MLRDGLLIFNSMHKVMQAEKALKGAGLTVRLIPVPRSLSSDCGLAMECLLAEREAITQVTDEKGCPPEQWHRRVGDGYEPLDPRRSS